MAPLGRIDDENAVIRHKLPIAAVEKQQKLYLRLSPICKIRNVAGIVSAVQPPENRADLAGFQ